MNKHGLIVFVFGVFLLVSVLSFYIGLNFKEQVKKANCFFEKERVFMQGFNIEKTKIINGTLFSLKKIQLGEESITLIYEDVYRKNIHEEVVSWEE